MQWTSSEHPFFVDSHITYSSTFNAPRPRSGIDLLTHINVLQSTFLKPGALVRPERWENLRSETNAIPGLWSNTLTFLNGNPINGNRACIGFKFALTE